MKSATARGPLCVSTSSPMRRRSIGCMPLGVATSVPSLKHLPPDLIVPAEASAPRMNDTGPEASPPLPSCSLEERMVDRLMPEPDPPLKIMPSSTYQLRIDGMVSETARMKQLWTRMLLERYSPLSVWMSDRKSTRLNSSH